MTRKTIQIPKPTGLAIRLRHNLNLVPRLRTKFPYRIIRLGQGLVVMMTPLIIAVMRGQVEVEVLDSRLLRLAGLVFSVTYNVTMAVQYADLASAINICATTD